MTIGAITPGAVASQGFNLAASTNVSISKAERSNLNDLATNLALASEGKSLGSIGSGLGTVTPERFSSANIDHFALAGSFTEGVGRNQASFTESSEFEGQSLGNLGSGLGTVKQEIFCVFCGDRFALASSFTEGVGRNQASFENSSSFEGQSLGNIGTGLTGVGSEGLVVNFLA